MLHSVYVRQFCLKPQDPASCPQEPVTKCLLQGIVVVLLMTCRWRTCRWSNGIKIFGLVMQAREWTSPALFYKLWLPPQIGTEQPWSILASALFQQVNTTLICCKVA